MPGFHLLGDVALYELVEIMAGLLKSFAKRIKDDFSFLV